MPPAPESTACALALLLGVGSCRASGVERDAFTLEADRIRRLTTPAEARVNGLGEIVREPHHVSQEWRFGDQVRWESFGAATRQALSPTYRCAAEDTPLRCSRSVPGDRFALEFAPDGAGRVRARLDASPD